jgi:uncharacterized membrane protein
MNEKVKKVLFWVVLGLIAVFAAVPVIVLAVKVGGFVTFMAVLNLIVEAAAVAFTVKKLLKAQKENIPLEEAIK